MWKDSVIAPGALSLRMMLVIWAAAAVVRLANIAAMPLEPELILAEDAWLYWANARSLLEYGTFADTASAGRMPGYFLFLAGLMGVFGPSLFAVLAVQALLDSVTCVVVGMIGARLSVSIGLVAGLLAAIWPNLVVTSTLVLTDSFFMLPFTAMLYASVRFLETSSVRWAVWTGLFLGAAVLVRAAAQYLPLAVVLLVVAVPLLRERNWRRGLSAGLAFTVAVALPLAPWLHRNVSQHDTLALTSQGGMHLLYWVVPRVLFRAQGIQQGQAVKELREEFQIEMKSRGLDVKSMNIFARDRAMKDFSLARLSELSPQDILGSWGSGMTVNLMSPAIGADPRIRALPHPSFMGTSHLDLLSRITLYMQEASPVYLATVAIGVVGAVLASLLQIYGFVLLYRVSGWVAFLGIAGMFYFLLISGPITAPKYRLPFEPVLIILQAMALVALWPRLRRVAGERI
jgi:hypothetical protein